MGVPYLLSSNNAMVNLLYSFIDMESYIDAFYLVIVNFVCFQNWYKSKMEITFIIYLINIYCVFHRKLETSIVPHFSNPQFNYHRKYMVYITCYVTSGFPLTPCVVIARSHLH